MNEFGEYFCGMAYGGQLIWLSDINSAKELNDLHKFEVMKTRFVDFDIVYEFI